MGWVSLIGRGSSAEGCVGDPASEPAKIEYATLAGMSDATIKAKTGCNWERWVWALDRVKAFEWPHRQIADYVHEKFKIPGWWTQAVTVGYERIKGLRAIGQRRGGGYEATKSNVFAVPVARLYRSCSDPRTRRRWLPGIELTVRTAHRDKTMRVTWPDGTFVERISSVRARRKARSASSTASCRIKRRPRG